MNVPFTSVLSKSHNVFKVFILSLDHVQYNSLTGTLPDCVLIISALVTQEFPVIVDSYLLFNYCTFVSRSPRPKVTRLDNNKFPTDSRLRTDSAFSS